MAATQRMNIDILARDKTAKAVNSSRKRFEGLKKSLFNVKTAMAGIGFALLARNLINTGKSIESLQVRLKFLFGSAEEGAKAFEKMATFASKVPFSLEQIQQGAGVLAVVSKDANQLSKIMEITGNVAAVTGLDFKTTAEQIQRSLSAGISAADLFREKGVRDMLGFKAGATVSIEETAAAFDRVFGKGGRFGKATDELAKTFEGTLSMIGDKIFTFKRVILEAGLFPELKKQFSDLDEFLASNSEGINKIAVSIGTFLAQAVGTVASAMKFVGQNAQTIKQIFVALIALKIGAMFFKIARALQAMFVGQAALASLSLGPVGWLAVTAAVTAAVVAHGKLGDAIDLVGKRSERNFQQYLHNTKEIIKDITTIQGLVGTPSGPRVTEKSRIRPLSGKEQKELDKLLESLKSESQKLTEALVADEALLLKALKDTTLKAGAYEEALAGIRKEYEKNKKELEPLVKAEEELLKIKENLMTKHEQAQAVFDETYEKLMRNAAFQKLSDTDQIEIVGRLTAEFEKATEEVDKLTEAEERARDIGQELGLTFTSAFEDAVVEGKKFREILQGIYKDILRIMLRKTITEPVGKFLSTALSAGVGSLFPGKQFGGSVAGGKPHIVGEAGPELFVPGSSGSIVPSHQLGGGANIVQNINVSTGVQQTVRAEIIQLMPMIRKASVEAVLEERSRGGQMAQAMGAVSQNS
jgi:hypothetical protein